MTATTTDDLKINPGDILGWPNLRIQYATDPGKLAALLPPGLEPSDTANVHLNIYCIPVPDEPEFGVVIDVDADYRGEVGVVLINLGDEPFEISRGMRIAQMVVAPVTQLLWQEQESLPETARGARGFGSTGTEVG